MEVIKLREYGQAINTKTLSKNKGDAHTNMDLELNAMLSKFN